MHIQHVKQVSFTHFTGPKFIPPRIFFHDAWFQYIVLTLEIFNLNFYILSCYMIFFCFFKCTDAWAWIWNYLHGEICAFKDCNYFIFDTLFAALQMARKDLQENTLIYNDKCPRWKYNLKVSPNDFIYNWME